MEDVLTVSRQEGNDSEDDNQEEDQQGQGEDLPDIGQQGPLGAVDVAQPGMDIGQLEEMVPEQEHQQH